MQVELLHCDQNELISVDWRAPADHDVPRQSAFPFAPSVQRDFSFRYLNARYEQLNYC